MTPQGTSRTEDPAHSVVDPRHRQEGHGHPLPHRAERLERKAELNHVAILQHVVLALHAGRIAIVHGGLSHLVTRRIMLLM